VPDAQDPSKTHPLMMFTTDLSLKFDHEYSKIAKRFHDDPEAFKLAFAKAWFKLTHRDMGPRSRYLGAEVPKEDLLWQDPAPAADYKLIDGADVAALKSKVLGSGLTDSRTDPHGLGVGRIVRSTDQTRRSQRSPHSSRAAKGLAKSTDRPSLRKSCRRWTGSRTASTRAAPTARKYRSPISSCSRQCGDRGRGEEGRSRREGRVRAGAHGRHARTDRRQNPLLIAGADRRRLPQLLWQVFGAFAAKALVERASMLSLTVPEPRRSLAA